MEIWEILRHVDHTLLKQDARWEDIRQLCDDAIWYQTASVCIPPCYVKPAAEYLRGRIPVCTVIGFPNGYSTTETKKFEAREAMANGAEEIDMMINIGWLKSRRYAEIEVEIRQIKEICGDRLLKVIIETCMLTEMEKIQMCQVITRAGADYIKTSSGFGGGGATFEDVSMFTNYLGPHVKIKAAGGIYSLEDAEKFLSIGAERLGTSRIVNFVKEKELIGSVVDSGSFIGKAEKAAQEKKQTQP